MLVMEEKMKKIDEVKLRIILINYKAYGVDVDKTVKDIRFLFEKEEK